MERIVHEELLDSDLGSSEEIALSFEDMRRVNRFLGGNRMHLELLRRVATRSGRSGLRVLEVASGNASALQAAALRMQEQGVGMRIALLDRSALHFPAADGWDARLAQPELVEGDALNLPFEDGSVDVVSCSLFLHHLEPDEVPRFFAEALRVARVGVIVNDLERGRRHFALSIGARLLYKSQLSMHDGPISVRRAYRYRELEQMAKATGHAYEMRKMFLFRIGALIWK